MATKVLSNESIDIGRVIQRGIRTISRHGLVFAALALLLGGVPTYLTQTFLVGNLTGEGAGAPFAVFLSPGYWGSILVTMICGYVLQATLVRASILDLSGRDPDIGQCLVEALKLILPMIGLAIMTSIICGIGFVLLFVPGIIFYLMLIVAVPVLVEERSGVIESMQRSRQLTKGSRGRIFLLLLLFVLAYLLVSAVFGFVGGIFGSGSMAMIALTGSLASSIVGLLISALLASLYVELRTIKEGATPEGLAAIFD
jgi:hypothetical protein